MNLHVDSNLALELPSDVTPQSPAQKKKSDPRAELASQFVPSGVRVLDPSGDQALQPLLPRDFNYSGIGRVGKKRPALLSLRPSVGRTSTNV
jgi:hypothetical protein